MYLFIYRYRHVRMILKNYVLKNVRFKDREWHSMGGKILSSLLFAAIFSSRNVFVSFRACKHCANALLGNVPIVAGDCSVIPYPWHAFHTKLLSYRLRIEFVFFFFFLLKFPWLECLLLNKLESLYFFFQTSECESNTCLILFIFKIIFDDNHLIWLLFARK